MGQDSRTDSNSNPHEYKDGRGYSAKFAIPLKQLDDRADLPPLFYALAVRLKGKWQDFLVISRAKLQEYQDGDEPFGSANRTSGDLEITIEFRAEVTCSGRNLTGYRNAWDQLPPLQPGPPRPGTWGPRIAGQPAADRPPSP